MGKKLIIIGAVVLLLVVVIIFLKKGKNNDNVVAQFEAPPTSSVNTSVTIKNTTVGGKTFDWDFGDGDIHSSLESPTHSYTAAGDYTITLTVNGKSKVTKSIKINPSEIDIIDKFTDISTSIDGPTKAIVGKAVTFTDKTPDAKNQKWDFGDNSFGTGTTVSHTFTNSGMHVVKLTNDKSGFKQAMKNVTVERGSINPGPSKPGVPTTPSVMIPDIPNADLMNKLQTIANSPAQYEKIMGQLRIYVDNVSIPVIVNNGAPELFGDFCTRIQLEKTKIKSLRKDRDAKGYITKIYITQ